MAEYIEREAIFKAYERVQRRNGPRRFETLIDSIHAADVAPVRHGRWDGECDGYAETEDGEMAIVYDVWSCRQCGHTIDDGTDDPALLPEYCPNCGAKMEEEDGAEWDTIGGATPKQ